MSSFFRIKGLAKGLDGLTVRAVKQDDWVTLYRVTDIWDTNVVMGDKEASVPVNGGIDEGMWIHERFLVQTDDPSKREYASDNPYGKFVLSANVQVGEVEVAFSRFEKSLQVSIRESGKFPKTLYAENFSKDLDRVQEAIYEVTEDTDSVDDLIFILQDLKQREAKNDGQA